MPGPFSENQNDAGNIRYINELERCAAGASHASVIRSFRYFAAVTTGRETAEGRRPVWLSAAFCGHLRFLRRYDLVIPSFCMRDRNVLGFTPSSAAAPPGPCTRPLTAASARRICMRS
jgi:hypothetical protein